MSNPRPCECGLAKNLHEPSWILYLGEIPCSGYRPVRRTKPLQARKLVRHKYTFMGGSPTLISTVSTNGSDRE